MDSSIPADPTPFDLEPEAGSLALMENRNTRVKINPETYIKFDGTDHVMMSNVYSDGQAMSLKSDILLLLWDIADWKSIGDILDGWPSPIDHPKILQYLANMYDYKMVVTDEGEIRQPTESGLVETLGNKLHINLDNHFAMLKDHVRVSSYQRAIERTVKPGDVVMDLGCGSGVLGFFAAKAGASKVYAVEKRADILEVAKMLADHNNLSQIEFVHGASSTLPESRFSPKPNLLVSEILGNSILEENVLEFTLDARQRFLTEGGKLMPWKLDMYVFAFHADLHRDHPREVKEFQDLYGIDFSTFGELLAQKPVMRWDKFNPRLQKIIGEPQLVKSLNFYTLENTIFTESFELPVTEGGNFTGYGCYFKAWLDDETVLTNSPWAPETHWTQTLYYLPVTRQVEKGDTLAMEMIYDGTLRIRCV